MIDEFQDTSIMQWNNFRPLIENSMAEGFDNLVVGDVKQSIYRWRNSDWQILGHDLQKIVDNERFISDSLTTNRRSCSNIITFNNTLFSIIPHQVDEVFAEESLSVSFKKLYSEAVQEDPGKRSGGFIRLEFIEDTMEKKWQDSVLEQLPMVIESFQDNGYKASDIGIIVRDGKEGALVLKTLVDHNNSCPTEKRLTYNFNVVSNDSLLLSNSPVINFLIETLSVVSDPEDMISRAAMLRFFLLAKGDENADRALLISEKLVAGSRIYFPEGYENFLSMIRQMPLFEATESIIKFFNLGDYSWNVAYLNTFQDYVVNFTGNKSSDVQSFLDWWESTGSRKSVVLPGNEEAMRILTIHKSKGLEFKVIVLPFLQWNLDHLPSKQPILWVKPEVPPFCDLGILPVKYGKELSNTIFADFYRDEKFSVYLDNINLLYVALTRAKEAIWAFSVDNPRSENTISRILKNAITLNNTVLQASGINLNSFYSSEKHIFECGQIPVNKKEENHSLGLISSKYTVSGGIESLKLKLHGENYFSSDKADLRKKINYGKLMHEIFESINSPEDISFAVRKLVLEGKLSEEESADIEKRVNSLISSPQVADWFMSGSDVRTEAGILMPSGSTRRPDRLIFKDGKTIIVDFKFGDENPHHVEQVEHYRSLLIDMGYNNTEAYIWYVDKNKIVTA
jgi:ATP-dependent helicase/nuclease subunit A